MPSPIRIQDGSVLRFLLKTRIAWLEDAAVLSAASDRAEARQTSAADSTKTGQGAWALTFSTVLPAYHLPWVSLVWDPRTRASAPHSAAHVSSS